MMRVNPAEVYADKTVENNAGGKAFLSDRWARLDRYLMIGSEGGTYYVSPRKNTQTNLKNVSDCIKEDGCRVVNRVVEVSDQGLATKNDQTIFVLALCMKEGTPEVKAYARANISKVVRTASHLTQFVEYSSTIRGWGRGLRKAVSGWYNTIGKKSPNDDAGNLSALVYQLMKYANRNGYTQRDILRLCHVKPTNELQCTLFKWITKPETIPELPSDSNRDKILSISEDLYKYAMAKQLDKYSVDHVVELVTKYRLPHEVIPTNMRNEPKVWQALLDAGMPLNAMIRNLGKLSQVGLLQPMSDNTKKVCSLLRDQDYIHKSRIHPINVLNQSKGYRSGGGRSGISWSVNRDVVEALEDTFYAAFKNVEPTGKNTMLALDVSGSMTWGAIAGMNLMPSEIAAAMAMVTLRTEPNCMITAFAHEFRELSINRKSSLLDVLRITANQSFGGTDCSIPMQFAEKNRIPIDAFVIYTDNETWYGHTTPVKALRSFRNTLGRPNAKMITCATTASEFTIADPNDPTGQLDIAGFSSSTPSVISWFIGQY